MPFCASGAAIEYNFDLGPTDILADGGKGSFFWDADSQAISQLSWDFGNGFAGYVDDSRMNWAEVFQGGTFAQFTFNILTGENVHPAACGGGVSGCSVGFFDFNGLSGFPAAGGLMGFNVDNLGIRGYHVRLPGEVFGHEGSFTAAVPAPARVPEPGMLSLIAMSLAGVWLMRRKRAA
jgi:hypothetical protein